MHYSDSENTRWWNGLTRLERDELLTKVDENARSMELRGIVAGVRRLLAQGNKPDAKMIAALRRWV